MNPRRFSRAASGPTNSPSDFGRSAASWSSGWRWGERVGLSVMDLLQQAHRVVCVGELDDLPGCTQKLHGCGALCVGAGRPIAVCIDALDQNFLTIDADHVVRGDPALPRLNENTRTGGLSEKSLHLRPRHSKRSLVLPERPPVALPFGKIGPFEHAFPPLVDANEDPQPVDAVDC